MSEYTRLTLDQRYIISARLKMNFDKTKIAKEIGKNKSSVGREIERHSVDGIYDPKKAEKEADFRQRNSHKRTEVIDGEMKEEIIEELIDRDWSPEEIYGRSRKCGYKRASTGAIYDFIYRDAKKGGVLYKGLRRGHRAKKPHDKCDNRGKLVNTKSIEFRPKEVLENIVFGHWEGDTIIGKGHKYAIVVLVERKTKLVLAKKIEFKTAELTRKAIIEMLAPFAVLSLTLTVDNGKEFADHEIIASTLGIDVYFAHKGCPGERGLCENTNSLFRQYLQKGSSFENITDKDIQVIIGKLNSRPRKILGYASPAEALADMLDR